MIGVLAFPALGAAKDNEDAPAPGRHAEYAQTLYAANCAVCHGAKMGGSQFGPPLKGAQFATKWTSKPEAALLDFVTKTMPPGQTGTLSRDDYRELVAYLFNNPQQPAKNAAASKTTSESVKALQNAEYTKDRGPIRKPEIFEDLTYHEAINRRQKLLGGISTVTDDMLRAPLAQDWLSWRRTYDNFGYSPLSHINRKTVSGLRLAWAWSLPASANEVAPIVHDGVIFVTSANEVQALDAEEGTLLWRYVRELPSEFRGIVWMTHRNIAIYGDNLYVPTADRHVIALAAKTGKVIWDSEIVPAEIPGILTSAGPIAVRGKILQSTSNGTACSGGCSIVGLDATTGKRLWKFDTIAQPGQPGGDTWNGASVRFGGGVWTAPAYDPEANLVYYGTGGTYGVTQLLVPKHARAMGSNDALYMDSTLALDPDTGRLVWHHQHMPCEIWDLDEAFERTLITLPKEGAKGRKLVVSTGKLGILDALDRTDGSYAFSIDFGLQNIVSMIDPATGRRTINQAVEPIPNKQTEVCPSPEGARNWRAVAVNPITRAMYLPMKETCMDFTWHLDPNADPAEVNADISWTVKPVPNSDGKYGRLVALHLATRKPLWIKRTRAPLSSSILATEGGLIFSGNRDRVFRASDDRTGETLWETRLSTNPTGSPITYSVDGKQFIAIIAGTALPLDTSADLTPEITDGTASSTLWVFALPDGN